MLGRPTNVLGPTVTRTRCAPVGGTLYLLRAAAAPRHGRAPPLQGHCAPRAPPPPQQPQQQPRPLLPPQPQPQPSLRARHAAAAVGGRQCHSQSRRARPVRARTAPPLPPLPPRPHRARPRTAAACGRIGLPARRCRRHFWRRPPPRGASPAATAARGSTRGRVSVVKTCKLI
eukprot:scaffold3650_cov58-Phaeocystis_antarctica.AAC.1